MKNKRIFSILLSFALILASCANGNVDNINSSSNSILTKNYIVKFNSLGGTNIPDQIIKYNEKIKEPDEPIKTGYSFKQWNYDGEKWLFDFEYPTQDMTLTAEWTVNTYEIIWENYDGTILEIDEGVPYGTMPIYNGPTPTKDSDNINSYKFAGWDSTIVPATQNVKYRAEFSSVANNFKVTWKNYDGTILEIDEGVPYGTMPIYNGPTPTKDSDNLNSYTFVGWNPKIEFVTQNIEYKAIYTSSIKSFTITWLNDDGSLIEIDKNVEFGSMPIFNSNKPSTKLNKPSCYEFSGWDSSLEPVTCDKAYKATFKFKSKEYLIGSYPQEKVDNLDLIGELMDITGDTPWNNPGSWKKFSDYYINSTNNNNNKMWYKDITFHEEEYRAIYKKDYLSSNNADENVNVILFFKFVPIRWKLINEEGYAIADSFLDSGQPFYHDAQNYRNINGIKISPNNYNHSDIRLWLNNSFAQEIFTNDEIKKNLVAQNLDSNESLKDFVSLPTCDQLKENFLPSNFVNISDYSHYMGGVTNAWLSDSDISNSDSAACFSNNNVKDLAQVDSSNICVCPMIRIFNTD